MKELKDRRLYKLQAKNGTEIASIRLLTGCLLNLFPVLKMEAVSSFEVSLNFYQNTRHRIPKVNTVTAVRTSNTTDLKYCGM
jgi:hypothetical protein